MYTLENISLKCQNKVICKHPATIPENKLYTQVMKKINVVEDSVNWFPEDKWMSKPIVPIKEKEGWLNWFL